MSFSALRPLARSAVRASLASAAPRVSAYSRHQSSRGYASAAEPAKGPNYALYAALAAVGLGGTYYGFSSASTDDATAVKDAASPAEVNYQEVYNAIAALLEDNDYDDGSYGPVLVRLAWHASGTYSKETGNGGSNGATMRFAPEANHGANAGLDVARAKLEEVKKQFPKITYSDLWTLAGVCAIQEMGGPQVGWRAGRKDGDVANCTPDGRLPDGDKRQDHLRQIFYRMGFNDQEIVALSGAHALGRCHTNRSGFEGPWTFSPTTFTNDYFKLLFDEKWVERKWQGPPQYEDKSTKSLMMLRTDLALVQDAEFKKSAALYAADQDKFFADFSSVFQKLLELGVPTAQFSKELKLIKTE